MLLHPDTLWQIAEMDRRERIAEAARQRLIAEARAANRQPRTALLATLRLRIATLLIRTGEQVQGSRAPQPAEETLGLLPSLTSDG